jgi:hypothetical protein
MKWVLMALFSFPLAAFAQLPIPITPDWLKSGGDSDHGVLHNTQVALTGNNYRILQTNLVARSRGFKLLGFITIKSPSYVQAVSRLCSQARLEEGHAQVLANVVYETGGMNLILFSLPKIRIRADLVEFTDEPVIAAHDRDELPAHATTHAGESAAVKAEPGRDRVRDALRSRLGEEQSNSQR